MKFKDVFPVFKRVGGSKSEWVDINIEMNDCAAQNLTDREAIQFSIKKFRKIKEIAEKLPPEMNLYPDLGGGTCPLCALYFNQHAKCEGCPVFESTGLNGCEGTPYVDQIYKASTAGGYVTACQAEIEFLEGLL